MIRSVLTFSVFSLVWGCTESALSLRVELPENADSELVDSVAAWTVSVLEPPADWTCDQLEFGLRSSEEIDAVRVSQNRLDPGSALDEVSMISRTGQRIILATGFDVSGVELFKGCTQIGRELDSPSDARIEVQPVRAVNPPSPLQVFDDITGGLPVTVNTWVAGPRGRRESDQEVRWRLTGMGSFVAVGSVRSQDLGAVSIFLDNTLPPGPFVVELVASWGRPVSLSGFQEPIVERAISLGDDVQFPLLLRAEGEVGLVSISSDALELRLLDRDGGVQRLSLATNGEPLGATTFRQGGAEAAVFVVRRGGTLVVFSAIYVDGEGFVLEERGALDVSGCAGCELVSVVDIGECTDDATGVILAQFRVGSETSPRVLRVEDGVLLTPTTSLDLGSRVAAESECLTVQDEGLRRFVLLEAESAEAGATIVATDEPGNRVALGAIVGADFVPGGLNSATLIAGTSVIGSELVFTSGIIGRGPAGLLRIAVDLEVPTPAVVRDTISGDLDGDGVAEIHALTRDLVSPELTRRVVFSFPDGGAPLSSASAASAETIEMSRAADVSGDEAAEIVEVYRSDTTWYLRAFSFGAR